MKIVILVITMLISTITFAQQSKELSLNLLDREQKEEIAKELKLDPDRISITPVAFEYEGEDQSQSDSIYNKGKVYISWLVRDISDSSNIFTYTSSNLNLDSNSPTLDGTKADEQFQIVKFGYQMVESVALEASYEPTNSTIELVSQTTSTHLGKITNKTFPGKIENQFDAIKIGLVGNIPVANSPSWRLDLIGGVNASIIKLTSSYKTTGDIYNDAFGYGVGGDLGIKITHKSGFFVTAGAGINHKTFAPYDLDNGAHIQFDAKEQYYFISVGYSFGGRKKR